MANAHVYRSGPQQFVRPAVDSSTVIAVGDVCWLDTDDVKPAGSYTWGTSDSATQIAFKAVFLGIANDASPSGKTDPINVDISPNSVYEFACVSTTWEIGTTFAIDCNGSDTVYSYRLEKQASAPKCIARAVNRATSSSTKVQVSFASKYAVGSANTNAGL